MIWLLHLMVIAQDVPPPIVSINTPAPPGAVTATAPPKGALVGCMFGDEGASKENPSFSGIGIYFPSGIVEGSVDPANVRDVSGLMSSAGFQKLEAQPGKLSFKGRNNLTLAASGGGIFDAEFKAENSSKAKEGVCQFGEFASREDAFAFFDELARQMKNPAESGLK